VAGALRAHALQPLVARRPLGMEPPPLPSQAGELDQELPGPSEEGPERPAESHLGRGEAEHPEDHSPRDRHDVERGRRERGKAEALLRVQHAHRHRREGNEGEERHHHAGQEHGELGLARHVVESRGEVGDDRPGRRDADQHQRSQDHAQEGQELRGEAVGLGPPLLGEHPRVGRHEGGRERPFGEQVSQEVGDPERDLEGVGVESHPQESREDLLPHHAQEPREEGEGRDEPRRPQRASPACGSASGALVLDLRVQAAVN
jgi:hypothetical protein